MVTKIRAKKNLYNQGKCFTKGKVYMLPRPIATLAGLLEYQIKNDLGEPHNIGVWWRDFEDASDDDINKDEL
jgi:hypothetical protein